MQRIYNSVADYEKLIKTIIKMWDTNSVEEIAAAVKLTPAYLSSLAIDMRKAGIPLNRKGTHGNKKAALERIAASFAPRNSDF